MRIVRESIDSPKKSHEYRCEHGYNENGKRDLNLTSTAEETNLNSIFILNQSCDLFQLPHKKVNNLISKTV